MREVEPRRQLIRTLLLQAMPAHRYLLHPIRMYKGGRLPNAPIVLPAWRRRETRSAWREKGIFCYGTMWRR
jgi:hypothetical protein